MLDDQLSSLLPKLLLETKVLDGQLSTLLPRLLLERSKNSRLSKTLLYTVQIHANGALAAGLGVGLSSTSIPTPFLAGRT